MTSTIEPATPADFLNISALDRIAWGAGNFIPDGEHAWRVWCEYSTVLVSRHTGSELSESGDIAGALVMFPTRGDELLLHKIMVHADVRGKGIGSQLMRAALERAPRPVLLTVNPDNDAAVKLYRNFGFEVRERIDGYYRAHEHRFVMVHPGNITPP